MSTWKTVSVARLLCVILLGCSGSLAWAGPDEDYKTGAKMYAVGDMLGAMPIIKKAADDGHAAAQALYADMILAGDAGDEQALSYFRKSAEQGNAEGQFGLGSMYASGEGVKRDLAEGRKWVTKAAEQGHHAAINEMALAYMTGGLGITDDARKSEQALRWIRQAADNNFLSAIREMVKAYRQGEYGLAPDVKLADQWAARERKVTGALPGRRGKSGDKK